MAIPFLIYRTMLNTKQKEIVKSNSKKDRYSKLGLADIYKANENVIKTYKRLNQKQILMFKECIHGYNAYNQDKLNSFSKSKKNKIRSKWKKSQHTINKFKEEVCTNLYNDFFLSIFKGTNLKKVSNKYQSLWTTPCEHDQSSESQSIRFMKLSQIGLDYDDVILRLIKEKILPVNFYSL